MKTLIFVILSCLYCFVPPLQAQEIQAPVDAAGQIDFIDAKFAQKIGLFSEYPNFREARLFQISDSSFVLEVFYLNQNRLFKNRTPLTTAEVKDFRRKVSESIHQRLPEVTLDQEGRSKLLIGSTTLGLAYYGWALPAAMDVQDAKVAVALYMLTSAAGFYLPFSLTGKIPVTDAAATLSLYGGSRGIWHGISLMEVLQKNPPGRAMMASGFLVGMSEMFAGFHLANKLNLTTGAAEMMTIGGDFGIALGLGISHLADFTEHENGRAIFSSMLIGSGLGLRAGKWLADQQPYTRGDAYVLETAGLLGIYVPLAVVDLFKPDNGKVYTAAAITGGFLGVGLGQKLVLGKDFTTSQASYISLSTLAGGLLGAGVAYLISTDENEALNQTLYLGCSSIGATIGFGTMYQAFAKKAIPVKTGSSLRLNLVPAAFVARTVSHQSARPLIKSPLMPCLQLDFTF